ncbi:hypothetical protein R1flu_024495 [Riccia fluitans]|uniref:Uncharacterized protein n=1 Tax=Riccia fluitans TaxID=41844 RepID=A0ABD1XV18_9MARC
MQNGDLGKLRTCSVEPDDYSGNYHGTGAGRFSAAREFLGTKRHFGFPKRIRSQPRANFKVPATSDATIVRRSRQYHDFAIMIEDFSASSLSSENEDTSKHSFRTQPGLITENVSGGQLRTVGSAVEHSVIHTIPNSQVGAKRLAGLHVISSIF